jgi:hypothetical protein
MDKKRFSSGETNPKLRARPGIAGAWPQGFAVTGSDEAAALDNAYVRSWSMRGDIRILCRMIPELGAHGECQTREVDGMRSLAIAFAALVAAADRLPGRRPLD